MNLRYAVAGFWILLFTTVGCIPAFPQAEFSADVVDLREPGSPAIARLYYTKKRTRIDILTADNQALIIRLAEPRHGEQGAEMRFGGKGRSIVVDVISREAIIIAPD
jgi:hypothetical protein